MKKEDLLYIINDNKALIDNYSNTLGDYRGLLLNFEHYLDTQRRYLDKIYEEIKCLKNC